MIRKVKNCGCQVYFNIYEDNKNVGYFSLDNYTNPEKELAVGFWNFVIFPSFRGIGYGKKALCDLIKRLKKEKIERVKLYVYKDNSIALSIYKFCGFKIVSETETTFWMELKLSS